MTNTAPSSKTCLVVDDSEIIRELASRMLADFGMTTLGAGDAAQALEKCREHKVDAVFLDWDLPSMGALDFLQGAAQLPAEAKPVVVLCATENDHQQFTLAKAAGAAHYILKPFDRHGVGAKLAEIGFIEGAAEAPASRRA